MQPVHSGEFQKRRTAKKKKEKTPHFLRTLDLPLAEKITSGIMEDYRVRRSLGEHVLRCSVLIAALFIMSLGIALSTKADLGVSPISCTPYVLSLAFPLTMGTVTILMHLSFVAV